MRTILLIAVAVVALTASAAWAYAQFTAADDSIQPATAVAAQQNCCGAGLDCCFPGSPCCGDCDCCAVGLACCFLCSPCCGDGDCCAQGLACCTPVSECCTAPAHHGECCK
jgi:hypothetical protein